MKPIPMRHLGSLLLAASLAIAFTGCGGKDAESEAAAKPAKPAAEAEAEKPAETAQAEESTTDSFVVDMSAPASPADFDAAVRKRDYLKATDVALRMNAQGVQGVDTLNRMREIQDEVARAAANGDPKARQAAEMLRRIGRMPPSAAAGH